VLHLHLPPEDVDPNVHPTKIEVRFPSEGRIHDLAVRAVRQALQEAGLRPGTPPPLTSAEGQSRAPQADYARASHLRTSPIADKLDVRDDGLEVHGRPLALGRPEGKIPLGDAGEAGPTAARAFAEPAPGREKPRAVAQLGLRYILVVAGDELLLVDQHRAAERVLFDELTRVGTPAKQFLAVPAPLELTPAQAAAAAEHRELLASMGFDLEAFGHTGWLLRSVPAGTEYQAPQEAVKDLLEELAEWKAPASAEQRAEQMRAMVACHAAVKAGQRLTEAEQQRLIDALLATSSPSVCPHGDPIILTLKLEDIDRRMERPARGKD
ncbi:MAG: hypothetical protein J7M26_00265, partial [Armatimonadetes bacterium]|nr:hypothetical protein [Armatimonadota bacterium]